MKRTDKISFHIMKMILCINIICLSMVFPGLSPVNRIKTSLSGRICRDSAPPAVLSDMIASELTDPGCAEKVPVRNKNTGKKDNSYNDGLKCVIPVTSTSGNSGKQVIENTFMKNPLTCAKDGFSSIKDVYAPPGIQYYSHWRLKFINPVEKCLLNRADQYDINPINLEGWGMYIPSSITRTLFSGGHSAGFFII